MKLTDIAIFVIKRVLYHENLDDEIEELERKLEEKRRLKKKQEAEM